MQSNFRDHQERRGEDNLPDGFIGHHSEIREQTMDNGTEQGLAPASKYFYTFGMIDTETQINEDKTVG